MVGEVVELTSMFIGGGALAPLVQDMGVCLVTAAVLCVICTKLKIPTIAAFLLAGVLVGPVVGGIVTDKPTIDTIASLGLILLLFMIGLEIDLKKLMASGKTLIITGIFQFPLCIAFGFAIASGLAATGWEVMQGTYVPLYVGFTAAASSTLLVVKMLQEKFQLDTVVGRVALGLLIFQDIWAIIVLAVQPTFEDPKIGPVGLTFLGTGIVLVVSVLLAKYLLPIAFKWIAKVPELMLVAAIGWCFGIGFFGYNMETILGLFGWKDSHVIVSMEMGALIAGASIATLPYAYDVISKVGIVKDFFITLFFVALGMGIPAPNGVDVIILAVILGAVSMSARYVIFFPLLYFTGMDRRNSVVASTKLAQVSEFCLVIAYLGLGFGHVTDSFVSSVIFAFVITALITPFFFEMGDKIHDKLGGFLTKIGFKVPKVVESDDDEEEYALAFLGFHRVASSLLEEMKRKEPELLKKVLVIDFNVNIHDKIKAYGPTVKYGDVSNPETLHHAGVDKAKVIVCTITDDLLKGTSNKKIVNSLKHIAPEAKIIANAVEFEESKAIYDEGAHYVYLDRIKTAETLLPAVLNAVHGKLEDHRKTREETHGNWHDRKEVFP